MRSTVTGHTPIGLRMLMSLASYFLDEVDFEYTSGERSWNTSRPTASLALSCPAFTNQILALNLTARLHAMLPASLFDGAIVDMTDRTLVMVMVNGIGAHLTNDEKRAHLIDLKRDHLVDQVCVQEILPPEK
jgi:hypothetical protein